MTNEEVIKLVLETTGVKGLADLATQAYETSKALAETVSAPRATSTAWGRSSTAFLSAKMRFRTATCRMSWAACPGYFSGPAPLAAIDRSRPGSELSESRCRRRRRPPLRYPRRAGPRRTAGSCVSGPGSRLRRFRGPVADREPIRRNSPLGHYPARRARDFDASQPDPPRGVSARLRRLCDALRRRDRTTVGIRDRSPDRRTARSPVARRLPGISTRRDDPGDDIRASPVMARCLCR